VITPGRRQLDHRDVGWRSTGRRFLREFGPSRTDVDAVLDAIRLRLDTFPYRVYQPMPWLGLERAAREVGTISRFDAMLPVIQREAVESAVDLGCNVGWYVLRLAGLGIPTIGIEESPPFYRTALLAAQRGEVTNVGVLAMKVTPETVRLIPTADAMLMLSIWHHFVRSYGLAGATDMLEEVWQRTRRVLLFETGEAEMTPDFGLPRFDPDPQAWLTSYLERHCRPSVVLHLGVHEALDPGGRACVRNLFAVARRD
jgi:hypothetical protein